MKNRALLTDLYQLTMNAAYFAHRKNEQATFDLFVRKLPKDWGYFIVNGVEDAIDYVTNLHFKEDEIAYLHEQGLFSEEYLYALKDFHFSGEVHAIREGTPIGANTPILRVTGPRMEAQFVETALLNTINFQTMIATKANRVVNAAEGRAVVDFGLRRAQEHDAAMKGARAAYIGGAIATSNVKAGMEYGIPIVGTHAHSFVMSFPTELDAFRAYVETFPNNATLLIDTYNVMQGARNAAIVAKELERKGKRLGAVRLDSGDLCSDSKEVRSYFNTQGLSYIHVTASNDLNEYTIQNLIANGAQIDGFGVGTEMITAKPIAAIPGVYKLVEDEDGRKIKLSSGKRNFPGRKQVYRVCNEEGIFSHDTLTLEGEVAQGEALLEPVVLNGVRIKPMKPLSETRAYTLEQVARLPEPVRAIRAIQTYEVKVSAELETLVEDLTRKFGGNTK